MKDFLKDPIVGVFIYGLAIILVCTSVEAWQCGI